MLIKLFTIIFLTVFAVKPFQKGEKRYTNKIFEDNKSLMYYVEYNEIKSKYMNSLQPVYIVLPPSYYGNVYKYYPCIILLGGLSESLAGPHPSSLYWIKDCNLEEALIWMQKDSLTASSVRRMMKQEDLNKYSELLKKEKLEDLIMICPYTYAGLPEKYNRYLLEELIEFVEKKYRILSSKEFRSINGVCLGGGMVFYYGFHYPDLFSSVGGVQADIPDFKRFFKDDLVKNKDYFKKTMRINLVESRGDSYLRENDKLVNELREMGIKCDYNIFLGGHGYEFYKGVGSKIAIYIHSQYFRKNIDEFEKENVLPIKLSLLSRKTR
ncbi:MAG: hypothetical protein JXA60_00835 [Candidatus Coatesbacteria bacterium]|nr:hypothetical protein [Candidatus Coatesbacteria bacterium]